MNSTSPQSPLAPETIFRPALDWNTIRETMPLMYSTLTGIRSRSSIRANAHFEKRRTRQRVSPTEEQQG